MGLVSLFLIPVSILLYLLPGFWPPVFCHRCCARARAWSCAEWAFCCWVAIWGLFVVDRHKRLVVLQKIHNGMGVSAPSGQFMKNFLISAEAAVSICIEPWASLSFCLFYS